MKNSRLFKRMAKSSGARALAMLAVILLVTEPYAFALSQIVSKYPAGEPAITSVNMGDSMTLYRGDVFGFNSAKSMSQTTAYAELSETTCKTPATNLTFTAGREGMSTVAATAITYSWDGATGNLGLGSIKTRLYRRNGSSNFQWNKTFFWDCGTPSVKSFSMVYKRGTWTTAGATNTFTVTLIKPDTTSVPLVNATTISATNFTAPVYQTIPATAFNQPGNYTLRISGTLSGTSNSTSDVNVYFDDVNLTVTSGYDTFRHEVEIPVRATPKSSSNSYTLEIRAKKASAGAENVNVWVYDGTSPDTGQGVGWVNKATINNTAHTDTTWTPVTKEYYNPDYSIPLSVAEYNSGLVRVRYVDVTPAGDATQDTLFLDYQRVTVDQGVCVDQVQDIEADCGKCHNYNGDITKPWPNVGMHNRHAQTESVSDCAWCHPDHTAGGTVYPSDHRNGVVDINGTKVVSGTNYNTGTKRCSNVDCHKGLQTPAWNATFPTSGPYDGINTITRNCSRCHNSGSPGAETYGQLNLSVAWPNTTASTDGLGHSKHNAAFTITQNTCQTNGSCHPDNTGQHTVVGDSKVVVKMASNYGSPNQVIKYLPDTTNKTGGCVNVACHGGQLTPRFNTAGANPIDVTNATGTGCIMCHQAEQGNGWGTAAGNASQYNSPISGLHRGGPPTSGTDHAQEFPNRCVTCHLATGPAKHFQSGGITNLDSTVMDTVLGTDLQTSIGYGAGTGTSPNFTTPPSCSVQTGGNCHAEGQTTYKTTPSIWARKWSWDAYSETIVDRCKNCHGHWGSFVTGVVQPHVTSNTDTTLKSRLMTNHPDSAENCATVCHAQNATGYNHGVALGATSKTMDVNSNAGYTDNGTTVGCGGCHANNDGSPDGNGGSHVFADSLWRTRNTLSGDAPDCLSGSCHGSTATLNRGAVTGTANVGANGAVSGDFAATRHHLSGTIDKSQCVVCHATATQPMNTGSANRDKIQLKNADTGATIVVDQALTNTNATRNLNTVTFCTSCHDSNGASSTFRTGYAATNPFGDGNAPVDIAAKYNSTVTNKTHNYSIGAVVPQLTKARSPHGKPGTNDLKQATEPTLFTDANPVSCAACHPAHGGLGTLNPVPTITGGADINSTTIQARMMRTGYAEPTTCFGCHADTGVKDYYGDNTIAVGGTANNGLYDETISNQWSGASGYQNSLFTYKRRPYWSVHQTKAGTMSTATVKDTATNIACSFCHDPHGAPTWAASGQTGYQTFSLRGNWLTSVYPEDRACQRNGTALSSFASFTGGPDNLAGPRHEATKAYNLPKIWGNGYNVTTTNTGHDGYYIDDNVFGTVGTTYVGLTTPPTRNTMTETDGQFAGLCANCHAGNLTGGSTAAMLTYLKTRNATGWAGGKIHQTVKGWTTSTTQVSDIVKSTGTNNARMHVLHVQGARTGMVGCLILSEAAPRYGFNWAVAVTDNKPQTYHQFSCSKCHTPHASSLPRLMISNCLDVGTSTTAHVTKTATTNPGSTARYAYTYPTIGTFSGNTNGSQAAMHCHNQNKANTSGGGGWNTLTGW